MKGLEVDIRQVLELILTRSIWLLLGIGDPFLWVFLFIVWWGQFGESFFVGVLVIRALPAIWGLDQGPGKLPSAGLCIRSSHDFLPKLQCKPCLGSEAYL